MNQKETLLFLINFDSVYPRNGREQTELQERSSGLGGVEKPGSIGIQPIITIRTDYVRSFLAGKNTPDLSGEYTL